MQPPDPAKVLAHNTGKNSHKSQLPGSLRSSSGCDQGDGDEGHKDNSTYQQEPAANHFKTTYKCLTPSLRTPSTPSRRHVSSARGL